MNIPFQDDACACTHEYKHMYSDTLYKIIKDYSHVIVKTEHAWPGVYNQCGSPTETSCGIHFMLT